MSEEDYIIFPNAKRARREIELLVAGHTPEMVEDMLRHEFKD